MYTYMYTRNFHRKLEKKDHGGGSQEEMNENVYRDRS